MASYIYIFQLLGITAMGAFVGEFNRYNFAVVKMSVGQFTSLFLAHMFVGFLLGYFMYLFIERKEVSLIIGALVSYQDDKTINSIIKDVLTRFLTKNNKDGDIK